MTMCGRVVVRDEVLRELARDLQGLLRSPLKSDERLRSLVSTLPLASSPLEALAVRGLLYDCMSATGACARWRVVWTRGTRYLLKPAASPDERPPQSSTAIARLAHERIVSSPASVSSVRELCAELGCGRASLDRAFREVFGRSAASYLRETRVKEALRLLRTTDNKVEAVAHLVGFKGKANLYRSIRQVTGLTPGQARRHQDGAT